ncbi:unnamed protein product [Amoebophrya sp. A25]|nr:unnamed protein product [Amoebophrya sp. A25]|eukprot:GSA25T00027352001.1
MNHSGGGSSKDHDTKKSKKNIDQGKQEEGQQGEHSREQDPDEDSVITFLAPYAATSGSIRACVEVAKEGRVAAENALAIYQWTLLYGIAFNVTRDVLRVNYSWLNSAMGTSLDLIAVPLAVYLLSNGRPPSNDQTSTKIEMNMNGSFVERTTSMTLTSTSAARGFKIGKEVLGRSEMVPLLVDDEDDLECNPREIRRAKEETALEKRRLQKEQQQREMNQRELFPDVPNLSPLAPIRVWLLGVITPLLMLGFLLPVGFLQLASTVPEIGAKEWLSIPNNAKGYLCEGNATSTEQSSSSILSGLFTTTAFGLLGFSLLYLNSGSKYRAGVLESLLRRKDVYLILLCFSYLASSFRF